MLKDLTTPETAALAFIGCFIVAVCVLLCVMATYPPNGRRDLDND